jgi:hypothetical protein
MIEGGDGACLALEARQPTPSTASCAGSTLMATSRSSFVSRPRR